MGFTRYVIAGRLIDGTGGPVQKNRALVVEDGRIEKIVSATEVSATGSAETIDLSHCTIMPPLMDCSIDILRSASTVRQGEWELREKSGEELAADVARHIHFCHSHGVLGLADSDSTGKLSIGFHRRRGVDAAVDIKTAGCTRVISASAEYEGDKQSDFLRISFPAEPAENASAAGTEEFGDYGVLCRLIGKAQDKGLKTVVQANGKQQVEQALQAGCAAIEQGIDMGEDNLKEMAAKRVLWIPSLIRTSARLESAQGDRKTVAEKVLKIHLAELSRARELGVPTAVGTGAGRSAIIHGEAVVEEIKLFIKAGYTLIEALRAASLTGAQFFGVKTIATLQKGSPANFIVSRGMVQQLPRKLSYLENIFVNGAPSPGYRKNPVKKIWKS